MRHCWLNASSHSVSLIECGPVNTNFLVNLQKAELGDASLQKVDAHTLSLYERYLQHCASVFQNAAQDTEDIVKVCLYLYSWSLLHSWYGLVCMCQ